MKQVWRAYYDEKGQMLERTPLSHPYNYESFVLWRKMDAADVVAKGVVYTDRLFQWDPKKYNELCRKHFGNEAQLWDEREPEKIEVFLRDYMDNPDLVLTMVMQGCNQASGFPLWILFYGEKA